MLMTYPVRPDKVAEIPAPTHVDGTGRLQTVRPDQNPRYHAPHRGVRGTDRRAGPAEHVVQRERADLLHARAGDRHVPADEDGRPGPGRLLRREARGTGSMTTAFAGPSSGSGSSGRMRILVLNQYFHPDRSAPARLLTELCEDLSEHHEVYVVTGRPSYDPVYRIRSSGLVSRERHKRVHVARVWSTSFDRSEGMAARLANCATYLGEPRRRDARRTPRCRGGDDGSPGGRRGRRGGERRAARPVRVRAPGRLPTGGGRPGEDQEPLARSVPRRAEQFAPSAGRTCDRHRPRHGTTPGRARRTDRASSSSTTGRTARWCDRSRGHRFSAPSRGGTTGSS